MVFLSDRFQYNTIENGQRTFVGGIVGLGDIVRRRLGFLSCGTGGRPAGLRRQADLHLARRHVELHRLPAINRQQGRLVVRHRGADQPMEMDIVHRPRKTLDGFRADRFCQSGSAWKSATDVELQEGVSFPQYLKTALMGGVDADLSSWILRLGALIILLDVAVDPFSQQLVQLRQDLVYNEDRETILSSAGRYSKGSWFRQQLLALDESKSYFGPLLSHVHQSTYFDQRRWTPIRPTT